MYFRHNFKNYAMNIKSKSCSSRHHQGLYMKEVVTCNWWSLPGGIPIELSMVVLSLMTDID